MIILNIDFRKIDQSRLKKTATGAYGDLVLIDSPRERNGIKINGFVKQGVSKEEREARVEMPILGDWREVGGEKRPAPPVRKLEPPDAGPEPGQIPF